MLHKGSASCKGAIIVDDDVWIGESAIIQLDDVHIGRGAVIRSRCCGNKRCSTVMLLQWVRRQKL